MDLQLGPVSRKRILPGPEDGLRAAMEQVPKAEALAAEWVERTRPVWTWVVAEWRRLGTAAVIILTVGLLLHAMFGANGIVVYRQKRTEMKTLESDVVRLQKENDEYAERIKALKSDPNAIEKEAREQLHYTRPGEVVYVTPEAPAKPPTGRAKNGK